MARLIPELKQYIRVASLEALADIPGDIRSRSLFLAGATSLAYRKPPVETVVDISGLPFRGCGTASGGKLIIGAMTTIRELETAESAASFAGGVLCRACDRLASTPLRNMITVGGNICAGFPWSDLPVALMALDAELTFWSDGDIVTEPIAPGGTLQPEKPAQSGRILTEITLPSHRADAPSAFIKFARTTFDYALVSAAVSFRKDGDRFKDVRIVAGGLSALPVRLKEAEAALEGTDVNGAGLPDAARIAAETVPLRPDTRAGDDYRRDVLATLVERAFQQAMKGHRS